MRRPNSRVSRGNSSDKYSNRALAGIPAGATALDGPTDGRNVASTFAGQGRSDNIRKTRRRTAATRRRTLNHGRWRLDMGHVEGDPHRADRVVSPTRRSGSSIVCRGGRQRHRLFMAFGNSLSAKWLECSSDRTGREAKRPAWEPCIPRDGRCCHPVRGTVARVGGEPSQLRERRAGCFV